jgi:tRNA(Ile)-lysidine synthase
MALATLMAQISRKYRELKFPKLYAFIIDHKLRKESSEEAAWVAEQLYDKCTRSLCLLSPQPDAFQ